MRWDGIGLFVCLFVWRTPSTALLKHIILKASSPFNSTHMCDKHILKAASKHIWKAPSSPCNFHFLNIKGALWRLLLTLLHRLPSYKECLLTLCLRPDAVLCPIRAQTCRRKISICMTYLYVSISEPAKENSEASRSAIQRRLKTRRVLAIMRLFSVCFSFPFPFF